jgi:hypothetical protein
MELYEAEPVVLDPSPFEVKLIIQSWIGINRQVFIKFKRELI